MTEDEPTLDRVTDVANTLDEVWSNFDPTLVVDPESEFYAPRDDPELKRLRFELMRARPRGFHAFLCGHGGSGKSTELRRLTRLDSIQEKFLPVHLSIREFGKDPVHLTHDALLVEIGRALVRLGKLHGMKGSLPKELDRWGLTVVKTFLHDEAAQAEAGSKAGAWLAFYKAALSTRREWKTEQKQLLEPRIQELVDIVNRMAQDLANRSGKQVLVVVDDIEKGDTGAHKDMHLRLFRDHIETLLEPRLAIVYTLPVYFRALEDNRVPADQMYPFSAVRIYDARHKHSTNPPLDREHDCYALIHSFVERRIGDPGSFFDEGTLDALILVGGGLFRETARAIRLAAQNAILRGAQRIGGEDAEHAASQIKKDYQPLIRGDAVKVLSEVWESRQGWVEGVEPYLQWKAVVEYENGDLWLDVRSVLKPYLKSLQTGDG